MATMNMFTFKSEVSQFEKELDKAEKKQRMKAVTLFNKSLRAKIKGLGLVDDGDLLKGVGTDNYKHASLVGMGAPAFHALIVEYGTEQRFTKGKGKQRKGVRSSGRMPAKPFFMPTFRDNVEAMGKILTEEWM